MKKYKAIIIDGKKLLRQIFLTGCLLLAGVLSISALRFSLQHTSETFWPDPERIIENVLPAAGTAVPEHLNIKSRILRQAERLQSLVLHFNPQSPSTIFAGEIPLTTAVEKTGVGKLARTANSEKEILPQTESPAKPVPTPTPAIPADIPEENRAAIKSIDASPNKDGGTQVILGNETSYTVDTEKMLATPPSIDMKGSGPKVLILHTHATEAYAPENSTVYDITASDRSTDPEKNVIKAGNAICEILNQKGIETLHDTTLHDYPSFSGSYAHALTAIENYLEQYPSIQIVFDIHRDSIVYADNTKARVVTEIDGKPAAQLMFVVGTDQKGLYNPNWQENIKNAIHFQDAINRRYPTLMRHINLRRERFNAHTTNASMIIETGSSGNSLSEAVYGLSLAAECIGDYLNTLK